MKKVIKKILPFSDYAIFPFLYPTAYLLKFIRWAGIQNFPICKKALLDIGVFPIRNHYYEPLFDKRYLRRTLLEDRNLQCIDWNIIEQLSLLESLNFTEELNNIPFKKPSKNKTKVPIFYMDNGSFEFTDAVYWYNLIRAKKPSIIIEIGSGYSTLMASLAVNKNKQILDDYSCRHICIEPYESPWLEQIEATVIRDKVENVDISIFKELNENDIVFIDSSHIIRPQGDVLYEYLELIPMLNNGVIVHIHDIFSPKDYPEKWILDEVKFWNEQYLLEAFLISNKDWKIIGALNFLHSNYYSELKKKCIYLSPDRKPGSFYMQKVS